MSDTDLPTVPNVDCGHKRVQHHHGTHVCYVTDGCHCDDCRAATSRYESWRRRQVAYGRSNLVDAEPARSHVRSLMAQGMGWKRIAAAAGVSSSTIYPLLYGKLLDHPGHPEHRPLRKQITRKLDAALRGVQLDLAPAVSVDATGTRRRIRALVAVGWSMSRLATELGIERRNFHLHDEATRYVRISTHQAVVELYERLWDQAPPAATHFEHGHVTRAKRYAADRRWAPPLAWDDDIIDDPAAHPELGDDVSNINSRFENVVWLLEQGEHPDAIAQRLGISRYAVDKSLARGGRRLSEFRSAAA